MLELEVSALLSGPVKWLRRTTTVDTLVPSLPAAGALHANIIILLTQRGIGFHLLCISAKMPRESLCFPITHTILCVPASILLIFLRSTLSFGLGFCLSLTASEGHLSSQVSLPSFTSPAILLLSLRLLLTRLSSRHPFDLTASPVLLTSLPVFCFPSSSVLYVNLKTCC